MERHTLKAALGELVERAKAEQRRADALVRAARHLETAERLDLAEAFYREAAALRPRDPGPLRALSGLLHDQGRYEEAFEVAVRALGEAPDAPEQHLRIGGLLARGAGDVGHYLRAVWPGGDPPDGLEAADALLRQRAASETGEGRSYALLGRVRLAQQEVAAAVDAYRSAAERDPAGWRAEFAAALRLAGRTAEADIVTGILYSKEGRLREATELLRRGIREGEASPEAYRSLMNALNTAHKYEAAVAVCREALRTYPDERPLRRGWLWSLVNDGAREEAQARARHFQRLLHDGYFDWVEHLSLPVVYASEHGVAEARAAFDAGLSRVEEAVGADVADRRGRWEGLLRGVNFYLAYQGQNDRDLQARYARVVRRIATTIAEDAPTRPPAQRDRIRVGFVSPFWYGHTVGRLFAGWITERDTERIEAFVYKVGGKEHALTETLRRSADCFRAFPFEGEIGAIEEMAARIAADELDILVYPSVGMHPVAGALAALRLAPVQAVAWGHPVTTGLETVDYFLSSEAMEPDGAEAHYTETLVRLPNLGVCVDPPEDERRERTRAHFGLDDESVLFVSPQSLYKYHPAYDGVYPAIAQRVPRAQFVFLRHPSTQVTRTFLRRMDDAFGAVGLDPAAHVVVLPRQNAADFIELNRLADVYLDSPGWSGGMTSLEALSTGVPAVTWPGPFMRGRHTYAFLRRLALPELIAENLEEYVEIAVRLGTDPDERQTLRRRILARIDRLFGDETPVRALERFFETALEAVSAR